MSIFVKVSTFALRQIVDSACAAVGIKDSGEAVVGFLTERFTDHSQRLTKALQDANGNAWKALEIALAGDSLWNRLDRAEDKAFRQQIRAFLDATPLPELNGKATFRQKCLDELRAARKSQALTAGTLDPRQLAQSTAEFARFSDPQSLLDAEWRKVIGLASQVKEAGFPNLAWLLSQRPQEGTPILVAGVRYFFRRAVEDDQKLFQGLSFARLEAMNEAQERGFTALSTALNQQGQRLEELLGDVKAVVVQTHSAVLDLQAQISGQTGQIQEIGQAVMKLLDQHQLQRRELRPADSMSIRNEGERQLVKQLVARYRALPEKDRQLPALLNAVGKLEVVAGEFATAQQDFQQVATLVSDSSAKAEAHFNAYQTALERRDFDAAMKEFIEAVKLDAKRYAPFPVGKYHPKRILGAGGFGTAFLCRHKYMNADVVVKTLHLDDLGRETDKVFTEAQVLRQLDHPAIIRISECGYGDAASKGRPHIIMDYFQGQTLEEYVKKHGPLPVEDLLLVAKQVAEGLQAAHGAKILHRDVKPANLLVRKEANAWKVKIIDFGLAMPQKVAETSQKASTAKQKETMIGSSIAGTVDYGAPEQMGRRKEPVGPYSDVYGWAKTCCYALFQTTHPLPKHFRGLSSGVASLLEECLDETPVNRPQDFGAVLTRLSSFAGSGIADMPAALPTPGEEFALLHEGPKEAHPGRQAKAKKPPAKRDPQIWPWVVGAICGLPFFVAIVWFVTKSTPSADHKTADSGQDVQKKLPGTQRDKGKQTSQPNQASGEHTSWKQIVGTYSTTHQSHRALGQLILDFGPDGFPVAIRAKTGESGLKTQRCKQIGETWMFDWGNIDLFVFEPQSEKSVVMRVYWAQCANSFDKAVLPNRNPDETVAFVRAGKEVAPPTSKSKPQDDWVSLFNGKDLTGWKATITGAENWKVESGTLVVEGQGPNEKEGWLLTESDFGDFKLRFEFQLASGAASAVTFRANPADWGRGGMLHGIRGIKVMDDSNRHPKVEQTGVVCGKANVPVKQDAELLPVGSWNRMEVEVRGQTLKVVVNGKEIQNVDLGKTLWPAYQRTSGRIGFQSQGGIVKYRDIEILQLPQPVAIPPSPTTPAESPTAKAMKAIQGEWMCVGMEEIGIVYDKTTIAQQDRRVTIKGNSYTMIRTKDGKRTSHVGTFVIDASNGHFDFNGTGEEWVGSYELDGDTLKVCYRYKRNADCVRPTEFKTDTARPNISVFYVFKRVTK